MPDIECIGSIEDRQFVTGVGNWTGPAVWDPGPYLGEYGLAQVTLENEDQEKEITLAYPYCYGLKNKPFGLSGLFTWRGQPGPIWYNLKIASGGNSFETGLQPFLSAGFYGYSLTGTLPGSWVKETTIITLKFKSHLIIPQIACINAVSLWLTIPETTPQHLPIMGIG